MKCFSELGAWRYALQMLAPNTGKPSRAECVKTIWILSHETTPAKLDVVESGVLCPSLTQHAFLVKSIFTSKMMYPEALCHPGGAFISDPKISKATQTLPISLERASCQRVLPFFQLTSIACLTEVESSITYLWLVFRTREFRAETITSHFLNT